MGNLTIQRRGFTIVELLIVIVVIAILAAISIVAYNGIQQRARNSALKSEMVQLQKKIQTDTLQNGSELFPFTAPLAYGRGAGSWPLAETLNGTKNFTMYSVFDTANDMSAAWSGIAVLGPNSSTNYISIRLVGASNSGVQGFWQTSAQLNQSMNTVTGIRNTIGRHVGWITGDGSMLHAGFDNSAVGSVTPTIHNGWTFSNVSTSSPVGISSVAVLVFPDHHDAATRAVILQWLDREHTITYYN